MKFIANISVLGFTPVPWTVPHFGSGSSSDGEIFRFSRRTRKSRPENLSPDLERWQKLIHKEAINSMTPNSVGVHHHVPHICPIRLTIDFIERTPPGKKHGQLWFPGIKQNTKGEWIKLGIHEPDLTNLVKAIEDALQGVVYHNDFQVRQHDVTMVYGETPGIDIMVQEIEENDYPGFGDPIEEIKPRRKRKSCDQKTMPQQIK